MYTGTVPSYQYFTIHYQYAPYVSCLYENHYNFLNVNFSCAVVLLVLLTYYIYVHYQFHQSSVSQSVGLISKPSTVAQLSSYQPASQQIISTSPATPHHQPVTMHSSPWAAGACYVVRIHIAS